jgi:hypothetical protein
MIRIHLNGQKLVRVLRSKLIDSFFRKHVSIIITSKDIDKLIIEEVENGVITRPA